jgi:Pectate lyase superfamily protein
MSGPTGTQKVFDITQYGASPTSGANNSKAINDAIQDALNNGGGVVYIPSGIWPFSDTLNLPYSVSIVGDGQSSQLLYEGGPVAILWQDSTASSPFTLETNSNTNVGDSVLPFASTAGITVDMAVSGQGISEGTNVAAVTPNSVTLTQSVSAEVESGAAIIFTPLRFAGQIADLWLTSNSSLSQIGIELVNVGAGHMNRIIITGAFSTAGVVMAAVAPPNMEFSDLNQCRIQQVTGDGIQLQGETWVCSAFECALSQNDGWGVNAPGGKSSFSVYNCDLQGNHKGAITGNFTVSEFEGNYYENADIALGGTPIGGPAILLGASDMISIKGNHIGNWVGPFGIDLSGGVNGCIVEGNQITQVFDPKPPWQNAGPMRIVQAKGGPNLRIRNNQILSPWVPGTPTRVQISTWTSGLDAGLRMSSFRFAASNLQPTLPRNPGLPPAPPRQLAVHVPLDEGVATFPTIAMEEPGYVVLVVARLTSPISRGNWTVGVQIAPPGATAKPITLTDAAGNTPLAGITGQTAECVIGSLGYDDTQDVDNQFPAAAQLGVTVETSASFPVSIGPEGIDVVVDVIVGFGALGI